LLNIADRNNVYSFNDAINLVDDNYKKGVLNYFSDMNKINEKQKITLRISENFDYPKYFSLQGSVLVDYTNNPYKVVGILKDITNRVQSEEMKLKYMAILDNTHDAILGIDTESVIYSWNKAASRIFLFTEDEVKGKKLTDICKPGEGSFDCKSLIDRVINGEEVKDVHVQRYDKNNNIKEILVSISKIIQNNEHTGYSVVTRDITDIVDYNKQLNKWQTAIEQSANVVVITNINGEIEYVNRKFYELTGFEKSEVIKEKPNILKSDYHSKQFYKELWNTITSGKVWKGEFLNRKKDGSTYWESAAISPVFNDKNEIVSFIAIKEDITQIKNQQKELEKAKLITEKANSIKSVILGNISHELRTPLNGILGGVQILKSYEDESYNDVIDIIDDSAERLKEALELLLDLSKIQTEDENIVFQDVSITELLKHLIYHYDGICESKKLNFLTKLSDDELTYRLDTNLFEKMINQLFKNSVKFSEKGRITLSALRNDKGDIVISLEDEGVGIPENKLNTILEEFRQVSEGMNRKYEGLGLGLTFVIKIVELFNGNFYIESKENEGTKVSIVFPVNN
jgi:PAS domain S-box-containing protein